MMPGWSFEQRQELLGALAGSCPVGVSHQSTAIGP